MAKVDSPNFGPLGLDCTDCPFANEEGWIQGAAYPALRRLCGSWLKNHGTDCPTSETYSLACELAEKEAQR